MKNRTLLTNVVCGFFMAAMITSCSKEDLYRVHYGTSFGMCSGYCAESMSLDSRCITYSRTGHVDGVKPIACKSILNEDDWIFIQQRLDIPVFYKLEGILGCPDCADGGAEWIEVELRNGNTHKVTFEYENEPPEMKGYIGKLRELISHFTDCNE